MGIKTTKYLANIIRMAADFFKFVLSSFAITHKIVVLTIQFVCV